MQQIECDGGDGDEGTEWDDDGNVNDDDAGDTDDDDDDDEKHAIVYRPYSGPRVGHKRHRALS